jgi:DNA-binding MarR family transcriptional regulator
MAIAKAARRQDKEVRRSPTRRGAPRDIFRLSKSPSHLLRRAEQYASELFARSELRDGVTLRQTVLLAAIAEDEGASQSDLVRTTGVDRSTLAEMMARMERKGLIVRAAAADDGRAKSVRLTAEGRRRLEEALPAIRSVDRALLLSLPAGRRAAFEAILTDLATTAETQQGEEPETIARKAGRAPVRPPRKTAPAKKAKKTAKASKRARAKR